MIEFTLPSLGAGMEEGKLLQWKIEPGQAVRRGDVVAVVDTLKAAVDIESGQEGTVFELLVEPGQTVPVGTALATFLLPGEMPAIAPHQHPAVRAHASAGGAPGAPAVAEIPAVEPGVIGRRRISPMARRRAEEIGIDVDTIAGTGEEGAITLEDVEQAARAALVQPGADRHAEMRRAIGAAMSRSKREIPHYYLSQAIPMRAARDWLDAVNAQREPAERLLMVVLQLKAVALALQPWPDLNGWFTAGSFRPAGPAHIGVAISLRRGGVIAPAIHDAGSKTLDELMRDLTNLVARARSGSLRSSEVADPTVTVTNLGDLGVDEVYGVIYPPQVALVGFGRIAARPWVEGGAVVAAPMTTACLAADHRVSDGHYGALFLAELCERLQHPEQL
ncbi:MAG: dihydrolipoamide acetyltransferase family protein [Massilia sp.]